MSNPPELPPHDISYSVSNLSSLMQDVDMYISELAQEQNQHQQNYQEPNKSSIAPTRIYSLHQRTAKQQQQQLASSLLLKNKSKSINKRHSPSEPTTTYNYKKEVPPFLSYHQPLRPSISSSATIVEPSFSITSASSNSSNEPNMYPSPRYNDYHPNNTLDTNTLVKNKNTSVRSRPRPRPRPLALPPPVPSHHKFSSSGSLKKSTEGAISTHKLQPSITTTAALVTTFNEPFPTTPFTAIPVSKRYYYMSILSRAFIRRIRSLQGVRELFCANEYPECFTGQESIDILHTLLNYSNSNIIPQAYCLLLANLLMKAGLFSPIHYSQNSIIKKTVFNSPDEYYTLQEDMTEWDVPKSILTSLLGCYTYDCTVGKGGGCYAPYCPNKPSIFESEFSKSSDLLLSGKEVETALYNSTTMMDSKIQPNPSATTSSPNPHIAWAQCVPKTLLATLTKKEIARQEAINELVYSELIYKDDLETLSDIIVNPLLTQPTILSPSSPSEREEFIQNVFGNYQELLDVSTTLYHDLHALQQQHAHSCIPKIGNVLIKHMAYFERPFTQYCPRVALAEYRMKRKQHTHPNFEQFLVQHVEKSKRMKRLPVRHFLLNPVTRLQRYPLLLKAILKNTEKEEEEYTYVEKCLELVKKVAEQSDALTEEYKIRVKILEVDDRIVFAQQASQDLQLTDPDRRLYYQGDFKRRSNGIEVTDKKKSDIHMFVFDHMVLMTKPRKSAASSGGSNGGNGSGGVVVDEYLVWKIPIPLQMSHVPASAIEAPLSPSSSSSFMVGSSSTITTSAKGLISPNTPTFPTMTTPAKGLISPNTPTFPTMTTSTKGLLSPNTPNFPTIMTTLTLHHLGQRDGVYVFTCTPEEKQKCLNAIEEAKSLWRKKTGQDVCELVSLDDSNFRYVGAAANGSIAKQGKVNCTVPFVTIGKEQKLAVGTETGIYFKSIENNEMKRVLSVENVTQLAVLEKYHILIVLAEKSLKAYPLDLLDSPQSLPTVIAATANGGSKFSEKLGQELGQNIHFFQVGICNNKDLLVFKKKRNTMSIFTALQPVYDLRDAKNHKYITPKTGFSIISSRLNHSWFKKYKEFYVGAEATNLHFLKSKFLIVCEKGFEIIDPENLSADSRDIPDKDDPQFNFLRRQGDSIKPLAMYRVQDKFLLCYTKFAFYINNRNGSLVQKEPQKLPLLCEWEGSPDHIVYQYPYAAAFSPQFIEIRHVDTGNLVQIIPGDQIRLTYYQTMSDTTVIQGCMTHSHRPNIQNVFYLKFNSHRTITTNHNTRKHI